MLIKQTPDMRESDVTPHDLYLRRREFIGVAGAAAAGLATGLVTPGAAAAQNPAAQKLTNLKKSPFSASEAMNSYRDVTTYNNFYEFGLDKGDPARHAHSLKTRPWTIKVEGECAKPGTYDIDDIMKWFPLEERIYRMRCVEAWSMVIPWNGFPLADFVKRMEPNAKAKFIEFRTLIDLRQMPGQTEPALVWPYREGLRLDEAMHPLALLAVGLYGEVLPNQNGAPIRLVVPWKYGFKGIKSIVSVRFVEKEPLNTWQQTRADEYGFYANVNPDVDHPRWTQKTERRIGEFFRRKTLPFNGYGDQVASLYAGMDLRKKVLTRPPQSARLEDMTQTQIVRRVVKPLVFLLALQPAAWLVYNAFWGDLGVNPVETITNHTGIWCLRFLVLTLAITPLRWLSGFNPLNAFRRPIGLFAFFYGTLHFMTYFVLDHSLELSGVWEDVVERPYITAGFTAFVLMIPLALTSTTGWIRRLGGRTWNLLHRLVYISALGGALHYFWKVKLDTTNPVYYFAIVGVLLAARLWKSIAKRRALTPAAARAAGATVLVGAMSGLAGCGGTSAADQAAAAQAPPAVELRVIQHEQPKRDFVGQQPAEFRWSAIGGADRYAIGVWNETDRLVWRNDDLASPSVPWPQDLVLDDGTYFWSVSALHNGREIAKSGSAAFVLEH